MPDPYVLVPAGTFSGRRAGDHVELPKTAVHHLIRVLRLDDDAPVVAADGAGVEADARVAGSGLRLAREPVQVAPPRPRVTVWQALGKGRRHDDVVRVLTELGVDRIVAVTSERTQVDLSGKAEKVHGRWVAVARAACEQARRPWLPGLAGPLDVHEALADLGGRACLVAHVGEVHDPLVAATELGQDDEVVLAIGPEGGWTRDELSAFEAAGATPVGLGPTVLRTEHAGAVLAAVTMAAAGRMGP